MKKPWHRELEQLILDHVSQSRKARVGRPRQVREETVAARTTRIRQITNDLNSMGILPESVSHFKERHVRALVEYWESRSYAPSSMQTCLTALRMLIDWLGKRRDLPDPAKLLKNSSLLQKKRPQSESRAWSAHGVDPVTKIAAVMAFDPHVGMQLNAILVFKLTPREALRFKPWRADKGDFLSINDGTRGPRSRYISPLSSTHRYAIDMMKRFVGDNPNASLSREGQRLSEAMERFKYVVRRAGLTKDRLGVTASSLAYEPSLPDAERIPAPILNDQGD